jgi:putative Mn2+ efflux pump MntP
MNMSRIINLLLILIGGFIAIYAQAGANQNQYILVAGIFLLMMGVYRISRNIPSKQDRENFKNNENEF